MEKLKQTCFHNLILELKEKKHLQFPYSEYELKDSHFLQFAQAEIIIDQIKKFFIR